MPDESRRLLRVDVLTESFYVETNSLYQAAGMFFARGVR
jgi:hypothetical protein